MDYLLIIVGFGVLIAGAHYLVDGASGLAKRFNVPNLVIGLTVVAFGTSAPELVVNLVAALNPATADLALTNIIGSNMINTYVILGVAAIIFPIASQRSSRIFDIPLSIFAPFLVLAMVFFDSQVDRYDGIILLVIFGLFMLWIIRKTIKDPATVIEEDYKPMKIWLATIFVIGGLLGLVGGAQLIVPSATRIAVSWGVSQSIIGLTIVALGTSLPELATSAVAAFKKNSDIALGNVIGSNIFNIFLVLGVSATISPLPAYSNMSNDLIFTTIASILVLLFCIFNKHKSISRTAGIVLLLIYSVYLYYSIAISA